MKEQLKQQGKFFNWGACAVPFIYGLCNRLYIWAVLGLIPYLNIIVAIVLGFRANEEAWEKEPYKTQDEFIATQQNWNTFGIVAIILQIFLGLFILIAVCGA